MRFRKPKVRGLLVSVLVYGREYAALFCGPFLASALDESNLPAIKDRLSFEIYTDAETLEWLQQNHNYVRLTSLCPVRAGIFSTDSDKHTERYNLQAVTYNQAIARAFEEKLVLSYLSPDTAFGKGVFPALLAKIDEGFGGVLGVPMRCAAEPLASHLTKANCALPVDLLFGMSQRSLNPLWIAAHWEAPYFSRIPYTLLWSDAEQLVARSATISTYAVVPTKPMLTEMGLADVHIQRHVERPYFAHEWSEFGIINVEPLRCWYPPFRPGPSDVQEYVEWLRTTDLPNPIENLGHVFTYRNPALPECESRTYKLVDASNRVVDAITEEMG